MWDWTIHAMFWSDDATPHTVAAQNLEYLFRVLIARVIICLGLHRGPSIHLQTFKRCLGAPGVGIARGGGQVNVCQDFQSYRS